MAALVDQSLLQRDEEPNGEVRFQILETIREYGHECLTVEGETDRIQARHADYFLAMAEQTEEKLIGPRQAELLAQLEREHDNMRTALAWFRSRGAIKAGLRLSTALTWFWDRRTHL